MTGVQTCALPISIRVEVDETTYNPGTNTTNVSYNFVGLGYVRGFYSYQMNATNSVYMEINYPNSQFRSPFTGLDSSNIIARIPITNAYGYNINFYPENLLMMQAQNITITNLNVKLYDDYGFLVNFQGSPWQAELYIQFAESENTSNQSAYAGTLSNNVMNPITMHPNAKGYNRPEQRDLL